MRPVSPFFVEHAGRMFEVVEMDAAPCGKTGKLRRCILNLSEQRFELAPDVPENEREGLICRALEAATGERCVRLIPVVGAARADGSLIDP